MSHVISVGKSCGGGWRVARSGFDWFSVYLSQSHLSLAKEIVDMYAPVWSKILASSCCICIVGCEAIMSLSGLHSCVTKIRRGVLFGGRTKRGSLVCGMWKLSG